MSCLSLGETGSTPSTSGFIARSSLPIGGDVGLPDSHNNIDTCVVVLADVTTPPPDDIPNPPLAAESTAYFTPYDNTPDNGTIDKRMLDASTAVVASKRKEPACQLFLLL